MNAYEAKVIKGRLISKLESMGISASATDSASIIVFTDRPVTARSFRFSKQRGLVEPYMTSFGPRAAEKFIANN